LTLPQRFATVTVSETLAPAKPTILKQDTSGRPERRRYSTDPKTFHALLAVAAENNSTKMSQAITRAIAQTMLADLCFMIYLTDNNNQMVIAGGYDLIREDTLEGGSLTKNAIPMLANSIQRGRPLRLPASSTSADIKGLGDILGLTNPGHLLYVPILTPEKETLGGILLLSPYSDRTWSAEDQAFLANIASSLVPIIQRNQRISKLEAQNDMSRAQVAELEERLRNLNSQLESARAETERNKSTDVSSLRASQEESQNIIEQLQRENAGLRAGKNLPSAQAEKDLKATLQEVAILQKSAC
jgi:GAF domain-containing protein